MVVRLLLSSLPDLSLFPRNNVSVFSQKILSYVDLCSQRLGPPLFAMAASLYISVRISKIPLLMRVDGKCIHGGSLGDSLEDAAVSYLVSVQILTMLTFLSKKQKKKEKSSQPTICVLCTNDGLHVHFS